MQAGLQFVMGMGLVAAFLIHLFITLLVGFMSDDYALIHSAQNGGQFWHLHSSWPLEFLWHSTARGLISAYAWHAVVLAVHAVNVFLFYELSRRWCGLTLSFSLLAATFYALSPAGIEALAWTCSAGYVLTMTWILTSLLCFLSWRQSSSYIWLKGGILGLMQLAAFLTWEWAVLVFPILCVFSVMKEVKGWKLLIPVAICWLGAVVMRIFSNHGVFWQHNDLETVARFFFGSPLLGLFPNLSKETYFSVPMLALFMAVAVLLTWAAWRQRLIWILLLCFFGAVLPWVKGGNPSSRYFYVAMPFLYLAITLALAQLKYRFLAWGLAFVLLGIQFENTYERAVLWREADRQAHALMDQTITLLAAAPAAEKIVLVNVPEAYGPSNMPMRPQMWYCGFKEYLNSRQMDVLLTKTDDSPFIWHRSPNRLPRHVVASMYPDKFLYEVVYDAHAFHFQLTPLNLEW